MAAIERPARVQNYAEAKVQYGDLIDRLIPQLYATDPLADAASAHMATLPKGEGFALLQRALQQKVPQRDLPEPLRALFAQVEHVPVWVDWKRIERAGRLLFRSGIAGGFSLGAKALLAGYCSPGGNKPLVYSGRLYDSVSTRLAETSKFVMAVAERSGMRRGGEGFAVTLRVRMIHAQIRRMILQDESWRSELWGIPINQHDMLGTILMFSTAFLEGIEELGIRFNTQEANDYMHLWRYVGYIIGVDPELLPWETQDARRLAETIIITQGEPDQDAQDLVHAFIRAPLKDAKTAEEKKVAQRRVSMSYGLARGLLGEELADKLNVPKNSWKYFVPATRRFITQMERARALVPGSDEWAVRNGQKYWKQVIELGLAGMVPNFEPPYALSNRRPVLAG